MRNAFLLVFGGVWLLVGLGLLIGGAIAYRVERQYHADGQVAEGTVLTKSIDRARRGSTNRRSTVYRVGYRFTTADGRTVEGSDSVGVRTWEGLEERGPVQVVYLPASPGSNRVAGAGDEWAPVVLAGLGTVLAPVGGVVLARGWRQLRTRRRLLREGMPAEATVTDVVETRVSVNRQRQWRIRYRYPDHVGQPREGRSGYVSSEEADLWRAGDRGAVRFDRERPEVSVWLGREAPGLPLGQPGGTPPGAPTTPQ